MEMRPESGLGLGERLRSARRARAMSMEQAASALHLEEGVLLALEEERFAELGAPVFVRGHLRSYARLLGLSEEAVLDGYRAADPSSEVVPRVTRDREAPLAASPGPYAVAAGVGLLILAVAAWLLGGQSPAPAPVPVTLPSATDAPGTPAPEVPGDPGLTIAPVDPLAAAATTPAAVLAPPLPGQLRLELRFEQASWIQVDDARQRLADGEQPAGASRTIDASPPVDITLGNAPGVRITVNGVPYEIPAAALAAGSNVARFRLSAATPAPVPAAPAGRP